MLIFGLLFLCHPVISQQLTTFPEEVRKLYMEEKYDEVCAISLEYLRSIYSIPDSLKTALHIRMAFFYSWIYNFNNTDPFIKAWIRGYPEEVKLNQLPVNEQADYLSMKAVKASYEGRKDDALDTLKMAIQVRNPNTPLGWAIQADGYQFRGDLEKGMLDFTEAILSFTEAENINNQLDRKGANCGIWLEKASASLEIEPDNPQILVNLNEALLYFQDISNHEKTAFAFNELGYYWREHLDFEKAINNFRYYVNIMELGNNTEKIHIAYNNLSATYNSTNRPDSVMYYMRKAVDSTPIEDFKQKALYYSNLGAIFGHLNKPDSALLYFKRALKLLYPKEPVEELSYNPDLETFDPYLPVIIGNKGSALFELAKNQNDLTFLELAVEALKISAKQFSIQRYMMSFETKTLSVRNSRDYYFLALEASAELFRQQNTANNLNNVIRFAQQSKAAVFNEYQRVLQARDSLKLDPRIIYLDDSLKSRKSFLSQRFYELERTDQSNPDLLASLNTDIIQTHQQIDLLSREIEETYPVYSQYIKAPKAIPVEVIQSNLHSNEILIDYTFSTTSLIILAISQNEVHVRTIPVPENFSLHVKQYRGHLHLHSGVGFSKFIHLGYDFWQLLIKPVEDLISGKQLIIIPDGAIGYLPFDTFVTDSIVPQRKHYNELSLLIKSHTISYLNSIDQFITARHSHQKRPVGIQAFAPFNEEPYLGEKLELGVLDGSSIEVSKISRLAKVTKHIGKKATKKAFQKKISSSDIIHLATHGILSSGNPMNNRILFHQTSPDTDLHLYEVLNMTINSSLVVLSACETGSGDLQEGEGIMSLTRGFHYAGTPALIMSLWPAFDTPSIQIMEGFYRELASGSKIADALRTSKLEYLDQAKSSESQPGLWANYQLSGVNNELPLKHKLSWIIWICVIIMIIITYFVANRIRSRRK